MAGGIRIEPYQPLGISTQAVPGGGYLKVDASVGNFGPSPLAQLGLQVAQGAAGIGSVVAEQLAGDNEALVKTADTRMGETEQALLFDPQNGYLNLHGQDAITQAPAVFDAYTKAQDRQIASLSDDDQRRMFTDLADRRLATFTTQVERHTAAERQRWYDTASDGRIALMQADAELHWNDDALLRRALGTARAEVGEQAERKGWDSALTEMVLRQQTSRTLVSAIGAAVDRDPQRAQSLRTRYAAVLEDNDRAALDALLTEAQARERAVAASTEILNAAPPDGAQPTLHWRLRQADAITDPAVRAATIRRLLSASAAAEAQARTLGEQVLAQVLKNGLTDPSQIPVREWVSLDAGRRQAIETRLDHNAAGTEPAPNPALVDALATQMTQAPCDFARRDLVPQVAHLPLPQWRRFRDWQAGLRRNDPGTEDAVYAIKRGFQIAGQMSPETSPVPDSEPSPSVTNVPLRAALVEEIDAARKLTGKSPDDAALREMVKRSLPDASAHNLAFPVDPRTAELGAEVIDELMQFMAWLYGHSPVLHLPSGKIAPPTPQSLTVPIGPPVIGDPKLHMMFLLMLSAILQSQTNRMARPQSPSAPTPPQLPRQAPPVVMPPAVHPAQPIPPQSPAAETAPHSPDGWWIPPGPRVNGYPSRIDPKGEDVYYSPRTRGYLVHNTRGRQGLWIAFNARGELVGVYDATLNYFTPRDQLSPEQIKEWTKPEMYPAEDPLPPPPGLIPPEIPKWQEGFTVVPSSPPLPGFSLPEFKMPPYFEAEEHDHHHILQFLWNPRRRRNPIWKPKYIFSPDAIDVFKGLTVLIPKGEHWGTLHAAYNREVARHLHAYLERKAKEHDTTPEGYAGSMGDIEARECFDTIKQAILNPNYKKRRTKKEVEDVEFAKEFLLRTMAHQDKKP